jgi:hypothetical protein
VNNAKDVIAMPDQQHVDFREVLPKKGELIKITRTT